jgi:hypothetical protein
MAGVRKLLPNVAEVSRYFVISQPLEKGWQKEIRKHRIELDTLEEQIGAYIEREKLLNQSRASLSED